jgi:hypothetical protein
MQQLKKLKAQNNLFKSGIIPGFLNLNNGGANSFAIVV